MYWYRRYSGGSVLMNLVVPNKLPKRGVNVNLKHAWMSAQGTEWVHIGLFLGGLTAKDYEFYKEITHEDFFLLAL